MDLPTTKRGNKHILVINDHFSKYMQLYAIKDRTALTAAKCVLDFSLKFGLPRKFFSDQDPAYESELFQCLMTLLGVNKLRTTNYHPQSNGLTEQSNLKTKQYLTAFLTSDLPQRPEWDCWTREASYAYNTSVHTSTGFTQAELMSGKKSRAPIDHLYGKFMQNTSVPQTIAQFSENMNRMYEIARRSMNTSQNVYASYHDKKSLPNNLEVDDHVFVYLPRNKRVKLTKKWTGPYKIIKADHPLYKVEVIGAKG